MSDFLIDEELLAAIDMGSNSFHLAIARVDHGEVKKVASMSEKVQLAAGLDENKNLTEEHSDDSSLNQHIFKNYNNKGHENER